MNVVLTDELREADLEALHEAVVKMANVMEDRDDAIRGAFRDGVSVNEIAATAELSRQRIHQIIQAAE